MSARPRRRTTHIRVKHIRDYVVERDGSICCYCDDILTPATLTLEHITPYSNGGTFNTTNLTVACLKCNQARGNEPFFEHCKQFNWPEEKIDKFHRLCDANLKIRVLNMAKENCLKDDEALPTRLIRQACRALQIAIIDFSGYEKEHFFSIQLHTMSDTRAIRCCFDQLIKIIEEEAK